MMDASSLFSKTKCGKVKVGERSFKINDEIDISLYDSVIYPIMQMNEDEKIFTIHEPINIYLSSPGGEMSAAFALVDIMQTSKIPIHVYALGQICSAATLILAAGHKRFGYANSSYMIHSSSTVLMGKAEQIESNVVELRNVQKRVLATLGRYTLITESRMKEVNSNEWWLTSEEALEYKLIDEII